MFPDVSLDDGQIARVLLPVWTQLVVRSVAVYRQSEESQDSKHWTFKRRF